MKNKLRRLTIAFNTIIVIMTIVLIILSKHIDIKYIVILQGISMVLIVNLVMYLFFSLINKYILSLSKAMEKTTRRIKDTDLNLINTKKSGLNIDRLHNNFHNILEELSVYTVKQNNMLKKYSYLTEELEKNNKIRDVILEVSNSITQIDNLNELYNLILKKAIDVIDGAHKGSIMVLTEENLLEYKAVIGYDLDGLKDINIKLTDTFLWNASNGDIQKPCIIRNIREFNKAHLDHDKYRLLKKVNALDIQTTLSSPIIINNKLYGMLNIDSINEGVFNEQDISLMSYFANQIGIAIKNHKLIERTLYLSKYDCLTNVYNRHYFEDVFKKVFKQAIRHKEVFSLVVFDLNKLKMINDTFGHTVGDLVIRTFAKTIKDNIRESDFLARYGGDEFVGVFFGSYGEDISNRILNIMNQLKNSPLIIDDTEITINFSFGIAEFPKDGAEIKDLFKTADKRMYEFKNNEKILAS
ncbi:sensor domain-containing diguanylate cyclase [Caldisalinibacter kiritimatiensis]|uniref:Sensory box/GGDEF domain protein n=1 Tax=Caldisalinibacter kiritimatiensis TaxID=1304284 RepID=R1CSQ4_9FIRM|nr:sensor domain-containing diguanylate cyclase [Caldisalinibacter kiritimatiensis]EOC99738.1 sensory box/GGDEF domain protein [Caldisalinibacter kiritimatiensis]